MTNDSSGLTVRTFTPWLSCDTSMRISLASWSALSCELACVRIVAVIFTSRLFSPCTRTSPNLFSTASVWSAFSGKVLLNSRFACACPSECAATFGADAKTAKPKNIATQNHRFNPSAITRFIPCVLACVIACSPEFPATCPASRGTWPAVDSANARSRGSARLPLAVRRWRCPTPAVSRGNRPSAEILPHRAAASLPPPAYRSPACTRSPCAALPKASDRSAVDSSPRFQLLQARFQFADSARRDTRHRASWPTPAPQPSPFATPTTSANRSPETPSATRALRLVQVVLQILAPLAPPAASPATPRCASTAPDPRNNPAAPQPRCSIPATRALPPRTLGKTPRAARAPPILPACHP